MAQKRKKAHLKTDDK